MKNCCVTLGNFIRGYLGFFWLQARSILCNLERITTRQKANSKESRCDIYFKKSLDSVDLLQRTHQITAFSFKKNLGLLDYEKTRDAGSSRLKKSRSSYQKNSPNEPYNIGKHASEFGTASAL